MKLKVSSFIPALLMVNQLFAVTPAIFANESQEAQASSESVQYQVVEPQEDKKGVFNEVELERTDYPASSLPDDMPSDITIDNLRKAVATYFEKAFNKEEKETDLNPLSKDALEKLSNTYSTAKQFDGLDIHLDQVSVVLEDQKHYITRVIINDTKEEADKKVENSDIAVLTEALSTAGNRLVMVCYYDKGANKLIPYHLTNRSKSLFTLDKEHEDIQDGILESQSAPHIKKDEKKDEKKDTNKDNNKDKDKKKDDKKEDAKPQPADQSQAADNAAPAKEEDGNGGDNAQDDAATPAQDSPDTSSQS